MLQLSGSRLKTALSARDMKMDMDMLGFDSPRFDSPRHHQQAQQAQALMDEMANMSSPHSWSSTMATVASGGGGRGGDYGRLGGVRPTNLEDVFGSLDPSVLSQLQGLNMNMNMNMKASAVSQMNSPTGIQMRPSINQQLRSSYPSNLPSSPVRSPSSFGLDPSSAASLMSSRSAAFAKQRSQSFVDRGAMNRHIGATAAANSSSNMGSPFSDWGSPTGKLDWGMQGEELNKFRKSASFALRGSRESSPTFEEPDVSWVQSLVKENQPIGSPRYTEAHAQQHQQQQQYHLNTGGSEMLPLWVEQLYMEQEQLVV